MPNRFRSVVAAALVLATPSAGVLAQEPPGQVHAHAHGPAEPLSSEALAALEAVRRSTARFQDARVAREAGYRLQDSDWAIMGEHWVAPSTGLRGFSLEQPAALQYVKVGGERVLVGVAYIVVQRSSDPPPEGFPGGADLWHYHTPAELIPLGFVDARSARQMETMAGSAGGGVRISMLHAWVWSENPEGVFAPIHRGLPYLRVGLPLDLAASGDEAAALGIDFASGAACERELELVRTVGRADAAQMQSMEEVCEAVAAEAERLVASPPAADELNARGAVLWRRYDAARREILTPEQMARLLELEVHLGGAAPTLERRPPGG